MAVKNTLAKAPTQQNRAVTFTVNGMEVKLTPNIVRNYLVSGNKEAVSEQEIAMFINLCKYSGLNPWLREAYCIKFGTDPATMVTGKEAFMKRAEAQADFDGMQAGVVVTDGEGNVTYRDGSIVLPTESLVGGWAEVYRKDKSHSWRAEVSFQEYAVRKKDGSLNAQWTKKPATMIRKVALVQALREAFPTNLGGMYIAEETGNTEPEGQMMDIQPPVAVVEETGEVVSQPEFPTEDLPYDASLL